MRSPTKVKNPAKIKQGAIQIFLVLRFAIISLSLAYFYDLAKTEVGEIVFYELFY